jgi:c-di-GMP-related signal transduction protein
VDATATAAPDASSLFLGRQPILDRDGQLFAFELLFRSGTRNAASFDDGVAATAAVITNTFNELGIEAVLGKSRGFINLTEAFLMSDLVELMPRDKVVLEVLETVRPTPQVAARCAELHRMGFSLALDDVVSADPAFEPLLPAVEFIKVDVLQTSREARRAIVHNYQPRGIKLVAEKVDSRERADECLALGFDYFQGYFFARPQIICGHKPALSEVTLLSLGDQIA